MQLCLRSAAKHCKRPGSTARMYAIVSFFCYRHVPVHARLPHVPHHRGGGAERPAPRPLSCLPPPEARLSDQQVAKEVVQVHPVRWVGPDRGRHSRWPARSLRRPRVCDRRRREVATHPQAQGQRRRVSTFRTSVGDLYRARECAFGANCRPQDQILDGLWWFVCLEFFAPSSRSKTLSLRAEALCRVHNFSKFCDGGWLLRRVKALGKRVTTEILLTRSFSVLAFYSNTDNWCTYTFYFHWVKSRFYNTHGFPQQICNCNNWN